MKSLCSEFTGDTNVQFKMGTSWLTHLLDLDCSANAALDHGHSDADYLIDSVVF
jgi:hypothetical protein